MQKHPYQQAIFFTSAAQLRDLPPDQGREVAIAGRSNAGKSSVINTLTNQKTLAKTSKTPGRTQLINYFQITDERFLVDLPGYGYAKVSKDLKKKWDRVLDDYLSTRRALAGLILVMDIRHPLTDFDKQIINWCQESELSLHIILNKCDKLKFGAQKNTLHKVVSVLEATVTMPVTLQLFSSLKKQGIEDLVEVLNDYLEIS